MNARTYYSARVNPQSLSIEDLYEKLCALYFYFRDQDFFRGLAGITKQELPEKIKHKAILNIHFQPFPIEKWSLDQLDESKIFDVIEYLYDHVAKPGVWTGMTSETGWNYYDYDGYDETTGREEFRTQANQFLAQYDDGYELDQKGEVLRVGRDGTSHIYDAGIIPYDEVNVDSKVRSAIQKWRSRHLNMSERKAAILELAAVFEWLKKSKKLDRAMSRKDESAIFEIANQFSIRHHDPKQKGDYDEGIWYAWIFHFYLATYHAVIRMLVRNTPPASIESTHISST